VECELRACDSSNDRSFGQFASVNDHVFVSLVNFDLV